MAVGKVETSIVFGAVALVAAGAVWHVRSTILENERINGPARAAGFVDAADQETARKAGVTDAGVWREATARWVAAKAAAKLQADAQEAAEKSAKKAREEASNARFQIAVRAAIATRESMKNPDSFKLERVVRMGDGSLCLTYRAANSFNAIIPGQAVYSQNQTAFSGSPDFPFMWAKYCKGVGEEIQNVAYALTYYPRK